MPDPETTRRAIPANARNFLRAIGKSPAFHPLIPELKLGKVTGRNRVDVTRIGRQPIEMVVDEIEPGTAFNAPVIVYTQGNLERLTEE